MSLRTSLAAVAVVVGTLFVVGCSQMGQSASPTVPTSVPSPSLTSSSVDSGTVARRGALASTDVVTFPVRFSIRPSGQAAIQACVGEAVNFAGTALLVAHQTNLSDGSTLLDMIHLNPQGAVATGTSTGVTFRLVGGESNQVISIPAGTLAATFEANLIAIGPGSANSFLAHILQHITIAPDGKITALVDVFSADCR